MKVRGKDQFLDKSDVNRALEKTIWWFMSSNLHTNRKSLHDHRPKSFQVIHMKLGECQKVHNVTVKE